MRLLIASLVVGLSVSAARGEEAKPAEAKPKPGVAARAATSFKAWFQHLKEGLTESSVSGQRQRGNVAAVAAVRGAAQGEAELDKPAWKSGAQARKSKALRQQRQEFAAAVDLAVEGKYADADQKLEAFEKAHPDSSLLADVKEARVKVKDAQKEGAPAPAQADAKPAQ